MESIMLFLPNREANYFCRCGWTGRSANCPSGQLTCSQRRADVTWRRSRGATDHRGFPASQYRDADNVSPQRRMRVLGRSRLGWARASTRARAAAAAAPTTAPDRPAAGRLPAAVTVRAAAARKLRSLAATSQARRLARASMTEQACAPARPAAAEAPTSWAAGLARKTSPRKLWPRKIWQARGTFVPGWP